MADIAPSYPQARWVWLGAFLGGLAGGLGQIPFALTPVALIGLAFSVRLALGAADAKRAGWIGFATGTGYFACTLHWIVEPFFVDPVRHGWMAPFALLFISTGFALFWAAAFWGARRIGTGWAQFVALAGLWAGVEMTRSYILSGFPWSLLGYIWTETSAAHLAALIGPFGLTAVTTMGIVVLARLRIWAVALGAVAIWAVAFAIPAPQAPALAEDAPLIRLVQPNAPQHEKWDEEKSVVFFQRQLDFTAASGAPDLTVWPETSIPYWLHVDHPALARIAQAADGRPVVVGAQRVAAFRAYNTLAVVGQGGTLEQTYDKHHLVPFGEYMPLGGLTKYLGLRSFAARDGFGFTAGSGPALLDFGPLGTALPLICYEVIFPQGIHAAPARPNWLLQITNDAWFGTFSGPFQHLAQARMRSIEQGLPMIRVANTGVSAVIDARGKVIAQMPLGHAGYLDHGLPPPLPPTLYARMGDLPIAILLGVMLAASILGRRTFPG